MSEQRDDALEREREMEQHEREAREREPDERRPGDREDPAVTGDDERKPAPPGTVERT